MKYLRKYNEELFYEWENNPECIRIQNTINDFNKKLINDEVWKNYYHKIDLYSTKAADPKFLEDIVEFAKKRIDDIKSENADILNSVKAIINEVDDSTDFIDSIEYESYLTGLDDLKFSFGVKINLNNNLEKKFSEYYSSYEIINFWPHLITTVSRLQSLGLTVLLKNDPYSKNLFLLLNI